MKNTYPDSQPAISAVGTTEVIIPTFEAVTSRAANRHRHVGSAKSTTEDISHRESVSVARRATRWYQRLLEIAAHNPPHLL
jgi:hypothetical protein